MKTKELLYLQIADVLDEQIENKVLVPGDKLPSLRTISHERGVSLNTALQAYFELERRGLIESRPKSGYFVSHHEHLKRELPSTSQPLQAEPNENMENIFF